jgi:hypothetical protein
MLLVMSACAGPRVPIDVGMRDFPTDILIGTQGDAVEPAPVEIIDDPLPLPVATVRGVRFVTDPAGPTPPPPACPEADPTDVGALGAELQRNVHRRPLAATHPYADGWNDLGGLAVAKPPTVQRSIRAVRDAPGGFTYEFVTPGAVTTYRVVPEAAGTQEAGIYLMRQVLDDGDVVFDPMPDVKLLPFPPENGTEWDSIGTDAGTGWTMILHGRIGTEVPDPNDPDGTVLSPTVRIDACGTLIDAWAAHISGPGGQGGARIIGPGINVEFTAFYGWASQYGTFPVIDETNISAPMEQRTRAIIAAEPEVG